MPVKILLVDVNPKMIAAWRSTFEENPEVEVVQGSMLDQNVDAIAWATLTYAKSTVSLGVGDSARVAARMALDDLGVNHNRDHPLSAS